MHNDSGDTARVFAIDGTGAVRGTYSLTGATRRRLGGHHGRGRRHARVGHDLRSRHRRQRADPHGDPAVPRGGAGGAGVRPALTTEALGGVETLHLTYPDGPHDAETFMIDPSTGDLVVVTKLLTGGAVGVYRAAGTARGRQHHAAHEGRRPHLPAGLANAVTGGDVAADGSAVVIRTYGAVRLYNRAKDTTLWSAFSAIAVPGTDAFGAPGRGGRVQPGATSLVTVSEGANPTLHISSLP